MCSRVYVFTCVCDGHRLKDDNIFTDILYPQVDVIKFQWPGGGSRGLGESRGLRLNDIEFM